MYSFCMQTYFKNLEKKNFLEHSIAGTFYERELKFNTHTFNIRTKFTN